MREKIKQKEAEIKELEAKRRKIKEQIRELQSLLDKSQKENKQLRQENQTLHQDRDRIIEDCTNFREQASRTRQKMQQLEEKLLLSEKELATFKSNFEKHLREAKETEVKRHTQTLETAKNVQNRLQKCKENGRIKYQAANLVLASIHEGLNCASLYTAFELVSGFLLEQHVEFISASSLQRIVAASETLLNQTTYELHKEKFLCFQWDGSLYRGKKCLTYSLESW